ncbi:50S ribosomal protein L25 [Candidatus Uhrbacteria bacterium]|nr:50S ribosomal protein L25 [Candidatus Uhrbacteria bacterium]
MQQTISLQAQRRDTAGKKAPALRRAGVVPAVLYGHHVPSQNVQIEARAFEKVYKQAGESTLVDLQVGDEAPVKVLIQEVAKHHLHLKPIHVDFYQVSMTEKLKVTIPLKFKGESAAIKELGGVLVKNLQELQAECLPQDLVHEIEVDIAPLRTFEDTIAVKDLKIPSGITVLTRAEEKVVLAQPPRVEEEAAPAPSEKEVIEKITSVGDEKKAEKAKKEEEEGKKEEKKK